MFHFKTIFSIGLQGHSTISGGISLRKYGACTLNWIIIIWCTYHCRNRTCEMLILLRDCHLTRVQSMSSVDPQVSYNKKLSVMIQLWANASTIRPQQNEFQIWPVTEDLLIESHESFRFHAVNIKPCFQIPHFLLCTSCEAIDSSPQQPHNEDQQHLRNSYKTSNDPMMQQ